jgi:hypothetical protein
MKGVLPAKCDGVTAVKFCLTVITPSQINYIKYYNINRLIIYFRCHEHTFEKQLKLVGKPKT